MPRTRRMLVILTHWCLFTLTSGTGDGKNGKILALDWSDHEGSTNQRDGVMNSRRTSPHSSSRSSSAKQQSKSRQDWNGGAAGSGERRGGSSNNGSGGGGGGGKQNRPDDPEESNSSDGDGGWNAPMDNPPRLTNGDVFFNGHYFVFNQTNNCPGSGWDCEDPNNGNNGDDGERDTDGDQQQPGYGEDTIEMDIVVDFDKDMAIPVDQLFDPTSPPYGDDNDFDLKPGEPTGKPGGEPAFPWPPANMVGLDFSLQLSQEVYDFGSLKEAVTQAMTWFLDNQTKMDCYFFGHQHWTGRRSLSSANLSKEASATHRTLQKYSEDKVLLIHVWTDLNYSSAYSDNAFWYTAKLFYGAFWKKSYPPNPIMQEDRIGNINSTCQQSVDRNIENGQFAKQLNLPALPTGDVFASEDGGFVVVNVAPVGEEGNQGPFDKKQPTGPPNRVNTYHDFLTLEWDTREWCGLLLCVFTVVIATILSACAALLRRNSSERQVWGAIFTEQGITDVLQVGWRYQAQQENGQLFLEVFDKARRGYNDENSVLKGGVEREVVATTIPTSSGTTSTPAGRSSMDYRDDQSQLPSTTFTASTPEQRSHQYEDTGREG